MSDTTAETKPADTQEVPASSTEETKQEPIAEKSEDVAPEGEASAAETTTAEPAEATTTSEEAPVATEDAQPEEAKEEEIEEPIEIPSGNGERKCHAACSCLFSTRELVFPMSRPLCYLAKMLRIFSSLLRSPTTWELVGRSCIVPDLVPQRPIHVDQSRSWFCGFACRQFIVLMARAGWFLSPQLPPPC